MTDRYWRKSDHTRRAWEYCETREGFYTGALSAFVVGYIIKKKNKHRCRDWLVYCYTSGVGRIYLGQLKDMPAPEAKQTAQLLIGAQQ